MLMAERKMLDSGLFPNTAEYHRKLFHRNLSTCGEPEDEPEQELDKCSDEYKANLTKDLQISIQELKLAEIKTGCIVKPEDETCAGIAASICDIEAQEVAAIKDIEKGCGEYKKTQRLIIEFEEAYAVARNEVARNEVARNEGDEPTCEDVPLQTYKNLQLQIYVLDTVNQALAIVSMGLEIASEAAESVPLLGDAASAPLMIASIAISIIIESLGIIIRYVENLIQNKENEDAECTDEKVSYFQEVTKQTYDFSVDKLEPKSVAIQGTADLIVTKVDAVQSTANGIEDKAVIIDSIVDDNKVLLEFLACQHQFAAESVIFVRGGCDGIDNDCDSEILDDIVLVDECDEDQIPPTITLAKDPPATFASQDEAVGWFNDNTVASDDCAPSSRLMKSIVDEGVEGQVTIKVEDTRCAFLDENTGEATATEIFSFVVDGTAPTVSCGFDKPQDVNFGGGDELFIDRYNEKKNLVNVQFFYNIEVRMELLLMLMQTHSVCDLTFFSTGTSGNSKQRCGSYSYCL
jgi:hypothetical protein